MKIIDCEQGTATWLYARCGLVTCSALSDVLAKGEGKTRAKYARKIASEKIRHLAAESYFGDDMLRGQLAEDEALQEYEMAVLKKTKKIGLCVALEDLGGLGYSPDAFVGDDGLLEIKTRQADLQMELLLSDKVPPAHMAQLQGGLLVTGRKWIDFASYCPGLPLFIKRVTPDAVYHAHVMAELPKFYAEVNEMVSFIQQKYLNELAA